MLLVSSTAPNVKDEGAESSEMRFGGWRSLLGSVAGHGGGKALT